MEAASLICLLGVIGLVLWLVRACVVGDPMGLRWRGIGLWRKASWEQVRDYSEKIPTRMQRSYGVSSPAKISVIQTDAGKVGVTNLWSNSDALRALVKRQATQAAAWEWDVDGCRAFDPWPRVFDYNTLENRWAPRIWLKLFLTYIVYLLFKPALQLTTMAGLVGWAMTWMTAGLYLLLVGSCGLIFLIPFAQYRAAGRRQGERITANLQGVVFENETRRVEAAWAEVTGYHLLPGPGGLSRRYLVETQQGEFDFLANIKQVMLLAVLIQRHAVNVSERQWRPRLDPEALGGEAARWSSGQVGMGARVYHYRTRMYRALLGLPLGMSATLGLLAWVSSQGVPQMGNRLIEIACSGALGFVSLGSWYVYRTCRIETDEEGLTQIMPFARHRLLWGQIGGYWLTDEGNGRIAGRGEQIRFGKEIVGYEELKGAIVLRATECSGREWAKRPARKRRLSPDSRRG